MLVPLSVHVSACVSHVPVGFLCVGGCVFVRLFMGVRVCPSHGEEEEEEDDDEDEASRRQG